MNNDVILTIGLLLGAIAAFVALVVTSNKLYQAKAGEGGYKHWMAQIVYLVRNYHPEHGIVVVLLLLFLILYVAGMIMLKNVASGY